MQLIPIEYQELSSKQKEIYNFQKVAAKLADYGFNCIKLADDWHGADFLAYHKDGEDTLKVQLKGRLLVDHKYVGKNLYMAFPLDGDWYLVPHDDIVGLAEVDGTASGDGGAVIGFLDEIESLPIDGLPFDDDDGAISAYLGYDINRYVGMELGYTDLGQFVSGPVASAGEPPQIDIESFSLLARLHYPLTDTISATWHLGLTESSFDVEGTVRLGGLFPNPQVREVPFTPVDDETGYRWGFGADWRFTPHVSVGLEFSRYDVKVFELDTYGVRLTGHL